MSLSFVLTVIPTVNESIIPRKQDVQIKIKQISSPQKGPQLAPGVGGPMSGSIARGAISQMLYSRGSIFQHLDSFYEGLGSKEARS